MDPKDVPICYDFALLFHEQKKQKKLIKYSPVIGYLLLHSDWGFCKVQRILLQMDPKDVQKWSHDQAANK